MLPRLTLVFGGAASGKSMLAEELVTRHGGGRVYLASAQAFDAEMSAKIARHLGQRGPDWRTVEAPLDVATPLGSVSKSEVVLFDCATLWLSNHMLAEADIDAQTDILLAALARCAGPVVVVSNELGMGIVPENVLARRFRDAHGRLNQRLAAQADLVVLVAAGLPLTLKGQLPEAAT